MSKSRKSRHPKPSPQRPAWLIPTVIIGAIVVILAILAVLAGSRREPFEPEVTGAPHVEIDQTSIDHGSVRFEQSVESVFRVRNVGDQPLVIMGEPRVELLQGC